MRIRLSRLAGHPVVRAMVGVERKPHVARIWIEEEQIVIRVEGIITLRLGEAELLAALKRARP